MPASNSEYKRLAAAFQSGSQAGYVTPQQGEVLKQLALQEAMTLQQKQAAARAAAKQGPKTEPLYELGKNIVTGETVYTNQPAKTIEERDRRLAAFVKSNPAQKAALAGKAPTIGTQDIVDQFLDETEAYDKKMRRQENVSELGRLTAVPQPPQGVQGKSALDSILSSLRGLPAPSFTPTVPRANIEIPKPPPPPPPALSEMLSPKAQTALAAGRKVKKGAELIASGVRKVGAVAKAGAGKVAEAGTMPGELSEFSVMAPSGLTPEMAQTEIGKVQTKVGKTVAEVAGVPFELDRYLQAKAQLEERARRRSLLGEDYAFALADEQRKFFQEGGLSGTEKQTPER